MATNEIKLVQAPVIKHTLEQAGQEVTDRIAKLNLENQIATSDTIKTLKEMRADLNKELAEFEAGRKLIKEGVNAPYNEFEALYKQEISDKYTAAGNILKDKIAAFEFSIKEEKRQAVESYFVELCASEKIDFIPFEKLGLDINLSVTEKKYKEQVNEFVLRVVDDLKLISTMQFQAEILVEYKASLNASAAITKVNDRKEFEKAEQARILADRTSWRQLACTSRGMKWTEITSAYEITPDIYITKEEILNLDNQGFINKIAEIEIKINEIKKAELAKESGVPEPVKEEPIQAPKVEESNQDLPIKTASFEVKGTLPQLRALGEYMKANNISYRNI